MAEFSPSLASDNERRLWGDACLLSCSADLKDTDALVLAVSTAQGSL
jgi:hypothetical protein